jgi:hypothetical protein
MRGRGATVPEYKYQRIENKEVEMKRKIAVSLISFVLLWVLGLFQTGEALAGDVDIHIGIGVPPPRVVIPAPPSVYLIPGSYVYYAPDVGAQLFFYSGYWYLMDDGYWFRSSVYRGPWTYLPPSRVPVVFLHLPPDYYRVSPGHKRIPYGQLKKNWKKWEGEHRRDVRDWERSYHERWKKDDRGWKEWKKDKPGKGR